MGTLVTAAEAAAQLDVSQEGIRRWRDQGKLTPAAERRRYDAELFDLDDLKQLVGKKPPQKPRKKRTTTSQSGVLQPEESLLDRVARKLSIQNKAAGTLGADSIWHDHDPSDDEDWRRYSNGRTRLDSTFGHEVRESSQALAPGHTTGADISISEPSQSPERGTYPEAAACTS